MSLRLRNAWASSASPISLSKLPPHLAVFHPRNKQPPSALASRRSAVIFDLTRQGLSLNILFPLISHQSDTQLGRVSFLSPRQAVTTSRSFSYAL
ncbi:hypothetical protein HZ326_6455 [Fusarium oxysporum f. sp. albedinis]|nr:hypothetical protein HZ326_6455 [Fusarium oxysporum f. sp. albedinis]